MPVLSHSSKRDSLRVVPDSVSTRVGLALTEFIESQERSLADISADLLPLHDAISTFTAKGKRLRPAFCWWGWRAANGAEDSQAAIRAAASLELLQAFALIHDDVMDGSEFRRGAPSAHVHFASEHQRNRWAHDSGDFGTAAAILLGDLCLSWADAMYFGSGLDAKALVEGRTVFEAMRSELIAGQYLDVLDHARTTGSLQRRIDVARYKSGKYTVERPLELGLTLGGADAQLTSDLAKYSEPLGIAFQLRDDVLGVFGDPARTGKDPGADLREGKRTYLIESALLLACPTDRAVLDDALRHPELCRHSASELQAVIRTSGALDRAEDLIAQMTRESMDALAAADVTPQAREALTELAFLATDRSS